MPRIRITFMEETEWLVFILTMLTGHSHTTHFSIVFLHTIKIQIFFIEIEEQTVVIHSLLLQCLLHRV